MANKMPDVNKQIIVSKKVSEYRDDNNKQGQVKAHSSILTCPGPQSYSGSPIFVRSRFPKVISFIVQSVKFSREPIQ